MGSTTPRDLPDRYLAAIRHLVSVYREDLAFSFSDHDHEDSMSPSSQDDSSAFRKLNDVPLIVNTMGWTKGLGKDLLDQIIEIVQPTDIISIIPPTFDSSSAFQPQSSLFSTPPSSEALRIHDVEPLPTNHLADRFPAKEWRAISALSYFYSSFPSHPPTVFSGKPVKECIAREWTELVPLSSKYPYELSIPVAVDGVYLMGAGSEDVVEDEAGGTLVGSLVGLVRRTLDSEENEIMDLDETNTTTDTTAQSSHNLPYKPGRAPPPPEESECIGLAFIRALNSTQTALQMLTPLAPVVLAQSNPRLIVKGCDPSFEVPIWGWLSGAENQNDVSEKPYLEWGRAEGAGATKRRVRRNLMRKGQM
jgi:polynucleotide 5'-hydroxyl-kinase GRC3/NOL9